MLLAGCSGPLSLIDPAGPFARNVAWLWWGMFAVSTTVLIAVVGLWLYASVNNSQARNDEQIKHIQWRWIVGGGLVLPSVSIVILLGFGIPAGHNMLPLPQENTDILRIDVTGHRWWWEVSYPGRNIALRDEIHIPAGKPVDLHLTSADVVHSFWVPRLGGKLDMLPGRSHVLRLEADEPGVFHGQCAEFCGLHHAHMKFTVTAYAGEEFDAWLKAASTHDNNRLSTHDQKISTDNEESVTDD